MITVAECVHHWVLEAPNGPMAKGRCSVCGEERDFSNWIPEIRKPHPRWKGGKGKRGGEIRL